MKIFGFELGKKKPDAEINPSAGQDLKTFTPPVNDDGAITVQSGAGFFGQYVDLNGSVKSEIELITRYRDMAQQPEIESAVDDIVNESVTHDEEGKSVSIILDNVELHDNVKDIIRDEFDEVLRLLNWQDQGYETYRRWYVDGRLFFHCVIDETQPQFGIQELRYIDPRRIRKVREIEKGVDQQGNEIIANVTEYFVYNEHGTLGVFSNMGMRIAPDSISYVTSGLMDSKKAVVLSYLHKAIKPLNNLRMIEDSTLIYWVSRAPERRLFYIDVGDMPPMKAEEYINKIMTKYRTKVTYDTATGEIKDDRKFQSMIEDFWLARRNGNKTTEIDTLESGNLSNSIDLVDYFQKKLYASLGVPVTRLTPGDPFTMGYTNEITRDEVKFSKFIDRLRARFTMLFDDLLSKNLALKGICSLEEWQMIKEKIHYDFLKDNNFMELKEAQLLRERLTTLSLVQPYVGVYFSQQWVRTNVLQQDDEEIEIIMQQIAEEPPPMLPMDAMGMMGGMAAGGGMPMPPGAAQGGPPAGGGGPPINNQKKTVKEEVDHNATVLKFLKRK